MDGVKIVADGIRLEKKMVKTNAKGKRQTRRSATHDVTDIKKTDTDIIIDATKADDTSAETNEDNSADRIEDDKGDEE